MSWCPFPFASHVSQLGQDDMCVCVCVCVCLFEGIWYPFLVDLKGHHKEHHHLAGSLQKRHCPLISKGTKFLHQALANAVLHSPSFTLILNSLYQ